MVWKEGGPRKKWLLFACLLHLLLVSACSVLLVFQPLLVLLNSFADIHIEFFGVHKDLRMSNPQKHQCQVGPVRHTALWTGHYWVLNFCSVHVVIVALHRHYHGSHCNKSPFDMYSFCWEKPSQSPKILLNYVLYIIPWCCSQSSWISVWISQHCHFLLELWISERSTSDAGGHASSMVQG